MVQLTNLEGFDMVYAVTQKTINDQLELLSALGVLPTVWKGASDDGIYSIDAQLGIPQVNLNTGDSSSRKVKISFPLESGKLSYSTVGKDKDGKLIIINKDYKVDGWIFSLVANMSLAELAQNDIDEHKGIPERVKQQLSDFKDEYFKISQLFLNFEDADLIDSFDIVCNDPEAEKNPDFVVHFKALVKVLIDGLKDKENPFIFGYCVNGQDPKNLTDSTATFVPTGCTYSVFNDHTYPDRNTLNYLLMTENKTVPGSGYGIFKHNWVNKDNVQGQFVMSETLIMNQIISEIQSKLVETLKKDINFEPVPGSIAASLNVANNDGGNLVCTITPIAGTSNITADFNYSFKKDAHDSCGTYIGYLDGNVKWTSTISFEFDSNNKINVTVVNSEKITNSEQHPNWIGKIEKALASIMDALLKVITFGLVDDIFNDMINNNWDISINASFASALSGINARIIPPAGSEFFFKDPNFYTDGSLMLTTTYKN